MGTYLETTGNVVTLSPTTANTVHTFTYTPANLGPKGLMIWCWEATPSSATITSITGTGFSTIAKSTALADSTGSACVQCLIGTASVLTPINFTFTTSASITAANQQLFCCEVLTDNDNPSWSLVNTVNAIQVASGASPFTLTSGAAAPNEGDLVYSFFVFVGASVASITYPAATDQYTFIDLTDGLVYSGAYPVPAVLTALSQPARGTAGSPKSASYTQAINPNVATTADIQTLLLRPGGQPKVPSALIY